MLEHVKVISAIGIFRGVVGALLGGALLFQAYGLTSTDYSDGYEMTPEVAEALLSFDKSAFVLMGWLCLFFAFLRTVQAIAALLTARWARPLGLGLARFDILNLVLFPVSTALGLYAFIVYRSPETAEYFKGRMVGKLSADS